MVSMSCVPPFISAAVNALDVKITFAGVVIDDFQERVLVDYSYYKLSYAYGITGFDDSGNPVFDDTLYRSVETIRGQLPVGYLAGGNGNLDKKTFRGYAGFYPVSG